MKNILILGASGATGRLVVTQLLNHDTNVIAVLRPSSDVPAEFSNYTNIKIVKLEILESSEAELSELLSNCDAVISCLGHNLTFKGIFGHPKLLVTNSIKNIAQAIEGLRQDRQVKFILMNTTGNSNRDIQEKPPLSQRIVISILRQVLPPHVDNEKAADYLRLNVGQGHKWIEWVAVRPDSLIDLESVSEYHLSESPTRNAIFDSGPTSRINVANFMSRLLFENGLWHEWKGRMPVIYNNA